MPPSLATFQLDRHADALVDVTTSLELQPNSFKALRTRARINKHLENYDAAVADFKSALEQAENEGRAADTRSLWSEVLQAEADLKRSKTKDYYKVLGMNELFFFVGQGVWLNFAMPKDCKKAVRMTRSRRRIAVKV